MRSFWLYGVFTFLIAIASASFTGSLLAFCYFFRLSVFGEVSTFSVWTIGTLWIFLAMILILKCWDDERNYEEEEDK